MRPAFATFLGLLTALLIAASPAARAEGAGEYEIKAGFLYHFAAFTEWPADTGPTLNLCVLGSGAVAQEIDRLGGRKVDARKIAVTHLRGTEGIGACQIVFLAQAETALAARVLEAARDHPILTVGESEGLARQGFVINLVLIDDKVRFEVNGDAAKRAKLALSSKLLRLASRLY